MKARLSVRRPPPPPWRLCDVTTITPQTLLSNKKVLLIERSFLTWKEPHSVPALRNNMMFIILLLLWLLLWFHTQTFSSQNRSTDKVVEEESRECSWCRTAGGPLTVSCALWVIHRHNKWFWILYLWVFKFSPASQSINQSISSQTTETCSSAVSYKLWP